MCWSHWQMESDVYLAEGLGQTLARKRNETLRECPLVLVEFCCKERQFNTRADYSKMESNQYS